MKYTITENKFSNIITKYIDFIFDVNDINWVNPYVYNDETGVEYEDANIIDFYIGDYDGPYDSNFCFRYYTEEYFLEGSPKYRKKGPLLEVHDDFAEDLNSTFGDSWHKPFLDWFELNFELPVKNIKKGISG